MNQWEVQVAIYQRLTTDAGVSQMVEGRVYDDVPQGAVFPYIVIGEAPAVEWSQDCSIGADTEVVVHVWDRPSQTGGPQGRKRTKQILQAVYESLHRYNLPIDDTYCVDLQATFQETFLDPDGITRHGVIRFRLLTTYS
ncbi:hypothetical protein CAL18_12400 [Bordetella genomosp. 7]|uniref:DUF3168 domain-containing protein n=1 Tax=Bordetella genomosp. 7 TaxID=1416805 RepID=UPI000B9EA916|nr:DUF3168 domain-containing protein [Bordetella genomosp. 7]OZI21721.1 hypothetical protein CAL18_12400 [Bordetella genomosp. 7]